jgi:FixJ family two-component response regulator
MGGKELSERVQALRPRIKVLFISGYTDDAMARHGVLEPGIHLLNKPFTAAELARKVREVLDS